jgi:hypothetical protein
MPPLPYSLYENPMTPDPNDRMAVPSVNQCLTAQDVFTHMVSRGSTVTMAEAHSVYEEFCFSIEQLVLAGNSISTSLFNIAPAIKGVFDGDDDSYDPKRHKVRLIMSPGKRLRLIEEKMVLEKVPPRKQQPVLLHYFDNASETQDQLITPGGAARITGSLLKCEEADSQQGIFFINTADGVTTRVSGKLLSNKRKELIFIIPQHLAAGAYRLEVRSSPNGIKTLRTGALPYGLTIS